MNGKITIAFVIDTINSIGGTEKQLLSLLTLLDNDRFNKYLVCLKSPDAYVHFTTFSDDYSSPHYSYHQFDIQSLISVQSVGSVLRLAKFLKEHQVDIVQTYFIDSQFIGLIAGRLAGTKKIIGCRRDLGFWHNRFLLFLLRRISRYTDNYLVNSLAVKQQVSYDEMVDPEKISVIYNGIDQKHFNGNRSSLNDQVKLFTNHKKYCVGISANFSRNVKRVDVFIRAAAEVLKIISDVDFCILGEGYLKDELMALAGSLQISEHVHFLGAVKDIPYSIRHWDVGVLSSDSEGLSNSILEYMASGIPVVATSVGGNTELVEDGRNGFLVPGGDHLSMAVKICQLLQDQNLRKTMGEEGKKIISEKYDWDTIIREYESYYRKILGYSL